jgi:hypothetical protein
MSVEVLWSHIMVEYYNFHFVTFNHTWDIDEIITLFAHVSNR